MIIQGLGKYIKLYASYYKEYCRYKEVEIVENKNIKKRDENENIHCMKKIL